MSGTTEGEGARRKERKSDDTLPDSQRPGVVRPALPGPNQAFIVALLHQFAASEWCPAEAIRKHQFTQLERLVAHAFDSMPFYRNRLKTVIRLPRSALDGEAWHSVPLLTRDDLNDAAEALVSRAIPESHGPVREERTSGSTSTPVSVRTTGLSRLFNNAFAIRWWQWAGRDFSEKAARIISAPSDEALPPEGAREDRWLPVFPTGPSVSLNLRSTIDEQLTWLQREQPAYLLTYPGNLKALAKSCEELNLRLDGLKGMAARSDCVDSDLHDICDEVFGASLTTSYSAVETGSMALQCPEHRHRHLQSEGVLIEVPRDDGSPCDVGETGRIVITDLHNFAMPLIRYDIGDWATVGGRCPCGRGLPVLTNILGRTRNLLTYPDGRQVRPRLYEGLVDQPAIRQFQAFQRTLEQLEFKLVVRRPLTTGEEEASRRALAAYLDYPFEIALTYVDVLDRPPSGKWEDFVSEVTVG